MSISLSGHPKKALTFAPAFPNTSNIPSGVRKRYPWCSLARRTLPGDGRQDGWMEAEPVIFIYWLDVPHHKVRLRAWRLLFFGKGFKLLGKVEETAYQK